ncbi:MAG TPA: ribonuclease PH [Thermoanaerobaculia bacterium]|nr:ribonuclease PH [Thermoanaerobaculia bacterium]HUM29354.1 ribonuclease PH [Thermoanaerobaculia bacterium]HXK67600.1 ribonuclease PH [Thermoanaerobaculia bacterium]
MRHERDLLDIRPIRFDLDFLKYPDGSVQVSMGDTRVICTVMADPKVPPFAQEMGRGWITSEYAMLPGSTDTRSSRDVQKGRPNGRSAEIQRLVGRTLRSVTELRLIPERTLWVDCDVIQADGGTRTAAINGAFVAMNLAFLKYIQRGDIVRWPFSSWLAAVSVGVVEGQVCVDLDYREDSRAEVDLNLAVTSSGDLVEIQGTAESEPISFPTFHTMVEAGIQGARTIMKAQRTALEEAFQELKPEIRALIPVDYLSL